MNPKILKYSELCLFSSGIALNIWIICHFTFFGGVDGPSHLYYSRVVYYLLSGNEFLSKYFVLNHLPVPNLTDHYLLALLDIVFRSFISEKILLLIFVVGFPLIFRHLVKRYNPDGIAASSFIIPFTHCTLLYSGAYNFCLSFTFLFIAIYYYFKNFSDTTRLYQPLKFGLFFLLVLLNYFTNGLSFLFLFAVCGLAELYWLFRPAKAKTKNKIPLSKNTNLIYKRLALFSLLWLPGFIMLAIFNIEVSSIHHANPAKLPFGELLNWFYNFKCLTVYGKEEGIYTHLMFLWLLTALSIVIYKRVNINAKLKFQLTDIFLILFMVTLVAYFIIPESAGVGMISDRLFYYFIIFLILWMAVQKNMGKIALLLSAVFLTIHFIFFFNVHYKLLTDFNADALDVQEAAAYVNPNSVVVPFSIDSKPLEGSISNVLGLDKPLLILQWYEADYGWFAVNRTIHKIPKLRIHIFPNHRLAWIDNNTNEVIAWIDYVFLSGDYYAALASGNSNINELLPGYSKIYSSDDNRIHIMKSNQ